jgi:hypothetical protein
LQDDGGHSGSIGHIVTREVSMRRSIEVSIELAAQELLAPPSPTGMVEVDDICAVDPELRAGSAAANIARPSASPTAHADEELEIELTPEQIDALLSGSSE